jgi:hypothetical protein
MVATVLVRIDSFLSNKEFEILISFLYDVQLYRIVPERDERDERDEGDGGDGGDGGIITGHSWKIS